MAKKKSEVVSSNTVLAFEDVADKFSFESMTSEEIQDVINKGREIVYERKAAEEEKKREETRSDPRRIKVKADIEKLLEFEPQTFSNEFDLTLQISNDRDIELQSENLVEDIYDNLTWNVKGGRGFSEEKNELLHGAMTSIIENASNGFPAESFLSSFNVSSKDEIQQEIDEFILALKKKYAKQARKINLRIKLNAHVSLNEDEFLSGSGRYGISVDGMFDVSYDAEIVSSDLNKEEKSYFEEHLNEYVSGICFDGMHFVPNGLKQLIKFTKEAEKIIVVMDEIDPHYSFQDFISE